jgi:hypothetical protein
MHTCHRVGAATVWRGSRTASRGQPRHWKKGERSALVHASCWLRVEAGSLGFDAEREAGKIQETCRSRGGGA